MFSLRNASGQTAADLAHAHGSRECFRFISNMQNHLQQLNELHVNGVQQKGNSAPGGQGLPTSTASRKRLLTAIENRHMKKARSGNREQLFVHMFTMLI